MTRITIPTRLGPLAAALALLGLAGGCNSQDMPPTDSATPAAHPGTTVSADPTTGGQPAPPPDPQSAPGTVRSMEEQHRDKAGK